MQTVKSPRRGEIWLVALNPTRGQEIQKTRPAIVVSSDVLRSISLRIAVPITSWQSKFLNRPFMVKVAASAQTGLNQESAANVLQIRSLSTERFIKKLGLVSSDLVHEILMGLAICTDYMED